MNGESYLLTIAQVGVALAGFTGLLTAFKVSEARPLANEVVGKRFILELSLVSVFAALLPFLVYSKFPGREWSVSSLLLAVYLSEAMVRRLRLVRQLRDSGLTLRTPSGMVVLLTALNVFIVVLQAANVRWNFYGVYETGLFWLLSVAAYQFVLFAAFPHGVAEEKASVSRGGERM